MAEQSINFDGMIDQLEGKVAALERAVTALRKAKDAMNGSPATRGKRIPIGEIIDRYTEKYNADAVTAAAVRRYAEGLGYSTSTSTYNSIHEALRRRVSRGEMVKDGSKFRIKKQV